MRKVIAFVSIMAIIAMCIPVQSVQAQTLPYPSYCQEIPINGGEQYYLICVPDPGFNGSWVVYAHGYVPPGLPLQAAWGQLTTPDGATSIPLMINQLGFGFAATTYRKTGLAVKEGLQDTIALADYLRANSPVPVDKIFLVGASEGGLIATQAMEQSTAFNAAVSACGPIGDFKKQIDYFGDFRVLFDKFFPGVLPGSPVDIPRALPTDLYWDWQSPTSVYQAAVIQALTMNSGNATQLIATSKAAIDPADLNTIGVTALKVLGYNVVATMEAQVELGVQPFGNIGRWYWGSSNDFALNGPGGVQRIPYAPSEAAVNQALVPYQTTGRLKGPLVTIHTMLDPEDPIWHQTLYRLKAWAAGKGLLYNGIPIYRYGHCNFKASELLFAFSLAAVKSGYLPFTTGKVSAALPSEDQIATFEQLNNQYGNILLDGTLKVYLPTIQQK